MVITFWLRALDWGIITLSLFNTITLLWLGLTVLLNAERRTLGTWVAGGGLVLCGLFFVGHTAVVGRAIGTFDIELGFWWQASWLLTVAAPYLWYVGTIWYTGVLRLWQHRIGLAVVTLLGLMGLGQLVLNPLPSYEEVLTRAQVSLITVAGIPIPALAYPFYSILCIVLATLALFHPQASDRFMGDLARRRARPWLVANSVVLIMICLGFAGSMAWFLVQVQAQPEALFYLRRLPLFMSLDLLLSGLVAVAVVLTGQAIVSYEIFTGRTLPRRGLRRYWRRCLILAAGYGAIIALTLSVPLSSIYRVLAATLVLTFFYALLSWRSYAERERSIDQLRPFAASQRLYERLLEPVAAPDLDAAALLRALCTDVLGARSAYLTALGTRAPLAGPALAFPDTLPRHNMPTSALAELTATIHTPQTMCLPVLPERYSGAVWAVPLWSERGLIGVLLLGPKHDGSLYTQEEIEIARATGERLIDTEASAEMARRLLALQRQRLAESRLLDGQARRVLHDDILPQLHTAMLLLGSGEGPATRQETVLMLTSVHRQIANLLHDMPVPATDEVSRLGLIGALRHAVEGELGSVFDGVVWQIEPDAERITQRMPTLTAEVVVFAAREAVRNAARYGRNGDPSRPLHLGVTLQWRDGLEVIIEDDGVGLGSSGALAGGSGHGLALHGTMMAVVGGTLTAESEPEKYTRVSLALPPAACERVLT